MKRQSRDIIAEARKEGPGMPQKDRLFILQEILSTPELENFILLEIQDQKAGYVDFVSDLSGLLKQTEDAGQRTKIAKIMNAVNEVITALGKVESVL